MTHSEATGQGYDRFYLQRNPAGGADYLKAAKGYERKLGPLLPDPPGATCLDLGCGTGMLAGYLRGRGHDNVVGVDLNDHLVAVARANVSAEFVVDDVVHYVATCGRTFDAIFLLNILEHIEPEKVIGFLTDVRSALNDNGFALVRAPNVACLMGAGHFHDDFTHKTALTENSLRQVAAAAGFDRVELCNQFRMQNFTGKRKACVSWCIHRLVNAVRGGKKYKVYYRNLYARLMR